MNRLFLTYLLLGIVLFIPGFMLAQSRDVSFLVLDSIKGNPISSAIITQEGGSEYAFTNQDGRGAISGIQKETRLNVSCLGYQQKTLSISGFQAHDTTLVIRLKPLSLTLEEITVTGVQAREMSTATRIDRTALNHTQPQSLYDVMQLVPGNLIENPDLSDPQQIKMREISNDANSALGTAIILDGNPLLNDANLQVASTAIMSTDNNEVQQESHIKFPTISGMGVDLRQFSTNNIESIEVIQGVPSVEYGNITSGAVIVKTKAGYTPLQVKVKADAFSSQVYAGKGFMLKGNGGAINVSADYLQSYSDILSKYEGYDRLNGQLGYFGAFMKSTTPLTVNAKFNVFGSLDNNRTDPDAMVENEEFYSSDKGFNSSVSGKWLLNKKVITGLKYTFSGSWAHQESFQKKYRTGYQRGAPTSMEAGEHYGVVIPSESLTEYRVDGIPYHFYAQLSIYKEIQSGDKLTQKIMLGGDYRVMGNNGKGQQFDLSNPPFVDINGMRPRSYQEIPSLRTAAFYVEDNLSLVMGKTLLELEVGVRVNNFQANGVFSSGFGFYPEPRANMAYHVIQQPNRNFHHLALRVGAGRLYKAPPLVSLYPNSAYLDIQSFLHVNDEVRYRSVAYTTFIFDGTNPDIKLLENTKLEVGLDFTIGKTTGRVTAFREESRNGWGLTNAYQFLSYRDYDDSNVPQGSIPDFKTFPYETKTYIAEFSRPVNNKETLKQGVEYSINFNKIPAIYTRFVLDGAWLKTTRTYQTQDYQLQPVGLKDEAKNWVGVYPAGGGRVQERLNSTLRMITHVPKVAMVFTTSVQMIWFEKAYFPYYQKVPLYIFNESETIPYTEEMRGTEPFNTFDATSKEIHFKSETYPPLPMVNLRLSKEIGDWLSLSFYANNFLNYRPSYRAKNTGALERRNEPLFFGADISFHL